MKRNFRDASEAGKTAFVTAAFAVRAAATDLVDVERDLRDLAKLSPPNPHDFLHVPDEVRDPRGEVVEIKRDLELMLTYLGRVEASAVELRAFLKRLLE